MMHDRTLKFLLAIIAVALWGFLLRPLLAAGPVQASPTLIPQSNPAITIEPTANAGDVYVVDNHVLYRCSHESDTGKLYVISKVPLH